MCLVVSYVLPVHLSLPDGPYGALGPHLTILCTGLGSKDGKKGKIKRSCKRRKTKEGWFVSMPWASKKRLVTAKF